MSQIFFRIRRRAVGLAYLAADRLEYRIRPWRYGRSTPPVSLSERGNGFLVALLLRSLARHRRDLRLCDQRLGLGLEVVGPEALEFELELKLCGLFLERRPGVLDALLDRLDGLVLVREVLELLSGGGTGGAFQVVDERLDSFLD